MVSFSSVAVIAAVALVAPLAVGASGLRLPAIVLEILLGIAIGPQGLGWATVDEPVTVLSTIGLAFLLLLAGLEIDFDRLRGRLLRLTLLGYAVSFAIAIVVGFGVKAGNLVRSPLLIAIILSATGLGIILPILKDAGETATRFGQVVVAGASIAEVGPIVLLSLFFSGESGTLGTKLALLIAFFAFVAAVGVVILGLQRSMRISRTLVKLQDTTAEIRVRGAFLLLTVFIVLASKFGLEAILGAFLAGATLKLVDRDDAMTHAFFHKKLEAAGFGIFVPFFFVSTGIKLDVESLFRSSSTLARVPLFLAAMLVVRALPALLYRPFAQHRSQLLAAGLLQATSLSIPVVAGQIGVDLGLIRPGNYVALVAAGLLSVVVFPFVALTLLRNATAPRVTEGACEPSLSSPAS
jgi:Kef-type K+ transport system membrane component KefB